MRRWSDNESVVAPPTDSAETNTLCPVLAPSLSHGVVGRRRMHCLTTCHDRIYSRTVLQCSMQSSMHLINRHLAHNLYVYCLLLHHLGATFSKHLGQQCTQQT